MEIGGSINITSLQDGDMLVRKILLRMGIRPSAMATITEVTDHLRNLRIASSPVYRAEVNVSTAISGGTRNRTGNTLVPIPVVTNRCFPSSSMCPAAYR